MRAKGPTRGGMIHSEPRTGTSLIEPYDPFAPLFILRPGTMARDPSKHFYVSNAFAKTRGRCYYYTYVRAACEWV